MIRPPHEDGIHHQRKAGCRPLFACKLGADTPKVEHQTPVVSGHQFLEIGGKMNHHRPFTRRPKQDDVDLPVRADVDATGRVVQQQDFRAHVQLFRQHLLLPVAAR